MRNLPLFEPRVLVQGFFDLVHVRNTGVAFSLLSTLDHRWVHPFLILATVLAMGAVLAYIAYLPCRGAAPVGLGLILGGAIGNLIDRARLGYVVDFIDLYWRAGLRREGTRKLRAPPGVYLPMKGVSSSRKPLSVK